MSWTGLARAARGDGSLAQCAGLDEDALAAILSLALSQLSIGAIAKAVRCLRGLVALEPRSGVFRLYLGLALERSGDLTGAVACYTDALDRLPHAAADLVAEAQVLRARAHLLLGQRAPAALDLSAADAVPLRGALAKELAKLRRALEPEERP